MKKTRKKLKKNGYEDEQDEKEHSKNTSKEMLEALYNTQTEHTSGTKRMIEEDDEGITQSKKRQKKAQI